MTEKQYTTPELNDEPEQMRLWRKIISYREQIALNIARWKESLEKQQLRGKPTEYLGEQQPHQATPELSEEHRVARDWVRVRVQNDHAGIVEHLREELAAIDKEIAEHSPLKSNVGKHGFTLNQLEALAKRGVERAEGPAKAAIVFHLELVKGGDEQHAEMMRRTAEGMLGQLVGRDDIDLPKLLGEFAKARASGSSLNGAPSTKAKWIIERVKNF